MTILSTLACTVSAAGISRPAYADIYETLQSQFQAIYGSDAYIDPDSQDGQWLAVLAKGYDDCNAATVAAYNNFSPASAQGGGLSNVVKINGIARAVATKSQVNLTLGGTAGTVIEGGIASDAAGNRWIIPTTTIGVGGTALATAEAEEAGAIAANAGTITTIDTPILGWSTVTNATAATPGAPVETDAMLRKRQTVSTALPSRTVREGLEGALLALTGVTQAKVYDNDTNVTDANGIVAHTIAAVVQGGVAADIADTIMRKKGPGCGTQGTTTVAVTDLSGNAASIKFYPATAKRIILSITVKALSGYTSAQGDALKAALSAYVASLGIGKKIDYGKLYLPAQLYGGAGSEKYEVDALAVGVFGGATGAADVAVAFNEIAGLATADITLTVT